MALGLATFYVQLLSWLQSNGLGRYDMPDSDTLLFHDNLIHDELQNLLFNGKARGLQGVTDAGTEFIEPLKQTELLLPTLSLVSEFVHPLA
jgi:hypothetical protein